MQRSLSAAGGPEVQSSPLSTCSTGPNSPTLNGRGGSARAHTLRFPDGGVLACHSREGALAVLCPYREPKRAHRQGSAGAQPMGTLWGTAQRRLQEVRTDKRRSRQALQDRGMRARGPMGKRTEPRRDAIMNSSSDSWIPANAGARGCNSTGQGPPSLRLSSEVFLGFAGNQLENGVEQASVILTTPGSHIAYQCAKG